MLIVKAKVKDAVGKYGDFSVAADFVEKLEQKVEALIKDACERAKGNTRKTVMGRDI